MSTIQRVAQIFGWVFVVVAVWGFVVSGGSMEADPEMAPKVMGLFPVNVLHNLVHLAFGVWGIMAARSIGGARSYALGAGVIYLVLAILGLFIPTTFGLIPIGGNDIWLHGLIAVVLLGAWSTARSATAAPADTAPAATGPAHTGPAGPTGTTGHTEPTRPAAPAEPHRPAGPTGHAPPPGPGAGPTPNVEGDRRP